MMFDSHGVLAMEHVPFPGSIGDSCAETARYFLLNGLTFEQLDRVYAAFRTSRGYVRHPDAPLSWREEDFSGDQALPLYLLFSSFGMTAWKEEFERRLRDSGWRLGNGDFISLLFMSVIRRANERENWFFDLPILAQAIAFRFIPFRWSDSQKKFESTSDSSADWLNYFHVLNQARRSPTVTSRLAAWLTPKAMIVSKIKHYYRNEPNTHELIEAYVRQSW